MASADSNPVFLLPSLVLPLLAPFCELWSIQFTLSHRNKERKSTVDFPNYLEILFKLILVNHQDTTFEKHEYMIVVLDSMSSH